MVGRLIPADQDAPEAVQPAVRAFHHPAPGFEPSFSFLMALSLLAPSCGCERCSQTRPTMRRTSVKVVAFIQAHTLGVGLDWAPVADTGHAVHRGPHQFHVVAVGPVHRQTHRNALGFGQQATFDAPLAWVGGVGAGFFPRPGAIWSGRRPCSPNSSPDPSVRHSVPVPPATAPETPQRPRPSTAADPQPTMINLRSCRDEHPARLPLRQPRSVGVAPDSAHTNHRGHRQRLRIRVLAPRPAQGVNNRPPTE